MCLARDSPVELMSMHSEGVTWCFIPACVAAISAINIFCGRSFVQFSVCNRQVQYSVCLSCKIGNWVNPLSSVLQTYHLSLPFSFLEVSPKHVCLQYRDPSW